MSIEHPQKPAPVCDEPCPIERGMRVLGGKWTGSLLWHLAEEPRRFNALCRDLGGASKKMVDQRLKSLEAHGLVKREVLSERPVGVRYSLTPVGVSSLVALDALRRWTEDNGI